MHRKLFAFSISVSALCKISLLADVRISLYLSEPGVIISGINPLGILSCKGIETLSLVFKSLKESREPCTFRTLIIFLLLFPHLKFSLNTFHYNLYQFYAEYGHNNIQCICHNW